MDKLRCKEQDQTSPAQNNHGGGQGKDIKARLPSASKHRAENAIRILARQKTAESCEHHRADDQIGNDHAQHLVFRRTLFILRHMTPLGRLYQLDLFFAQIQADSGQKKQSPRACGCQNADRKSRLQKILPGNRVVDQVRSDHVRHSIIGSPVDLDIIAVVILDLSLLQAIFQGIPASQLIPGEVFEFIGIRVHGKDESVFPRPDQGQLVLQRKLLQRSVHHQRIVLDIQISDDSPVFIMDRNKHFTPVRHPFRRGFILVLDRHSVSRADSILRHFLIKHGWVRQGSGLRLDVAPAIQKLNLICTNRKGKIIQLRGICRVVRHAGQQAFQNGQLLLLMIFIIRNEPFCEHFLPIDALFNLRRLYGSGLCPSRHQGQRPKIHMEQKQDDNDRTGENQELLLSASMGNRRSGMCEIRKDLHLFLPKKENRVIHQHSAKQRKQDAEHIPDQRICAFQFFLGNRTCDPRVIVRNINIQTLSLDFHPAKGRIFHLIRIKPDLPDRLKPDCFIRIIQKPGGSGIPGKIKSAVADDIVLHEHHPGIRKCQKRLLDRVTRQNGKRMLLIERLYTPEERVFHQRGDLGFLCIFPRFFHHHILFGIQHRGNNHHFTLKCLIKHILHPVNGSLLLVQDGRQDISLPVQDPDIIEPPCQIQSLQVLVGNPEFRIHIRKTAQQREILLIKLMIRVFHAVKRIDCILIALFQVRDILFHLALYQPDRAGVLNLSQQKIKQGSRHTPQQDRKDDSELRIL